MRRAAAASVLLLAAVTACEAPPPATPAPAPTPTPAPPPAIVAAPPPVASVPADTAAPSSTSLPPAPSAAAPEDAPPAPEPAPARDPAIERLMDAVGKNADVLALCRATDAQGRRCMMHLAERGVGACPRGLTTLHPCLHVIEVSAHMVSHASRMASIHVHPDGRVLGVADLFCPPMPPAVWARRQRESRAGKEHDSCPDPVPGP